VVLNPDSEGRIRVPGTLCAALSSLSIKRLIFCLTSDYYLVVIIGLTDFVLL